MLPYDKSEIFERAKSECSSKKLIWIEEVISFLPCSKSTFYQYFPFDSEELDELKALIEDNRISLKAAMRKKWFDSDAPALQIGLMKLLGSDEEAHRLNGSKTESKSIVQVDLSDEPIIFE